VIFFWSPPKTIRHKRKKHWSQCLLGFPVRDLDEVPPHVSRSPKLRSRIPEPLIRLGTYLPTSRLLVAFPLCPLNKIQVMGPTDPGANGWLASEFEIWMRSPNSLSLSVLLCWGEPALQTRFKVSPSREGEMEASAQRRNRIPCTHSSRSEAPNRYPLSVPNRSLKFLIF